MSLVLTVTAKGQVTLRKEVLAHLGVRQGDRLQVDLLPGNRVQVRATPRNAVESVFGMLAAPDNPQLTIEEIARVGHEGWLGRR